MATASISFSGWKGLLYDQYNNVSGWSEEYSYPNGPQNGVVAGYNNYSVFRVSWGAITGAGSLSTLSVTVGLRMNNQNTPSVTARAYLSTQSYGSGVGSFSGSYIDYSDKEVKFSGWSTQSVTFTFNVSSRSVAGETLYVWLTGDNGLYNNMPGSSLGWSGSVGYTLKTYTISYANGGLGTAPVAQPKTYGTNINLQGFIANQPVDSHIVSFNANNGNSTPSPITSKAIKAQTYWRASNGTNYGSGAVYSANESTTMTAIWNGGTQQAITLPGAITKNSSISTYTVSYNANGGTSTPSNQTLTRTTPYSFANWNTNSSGTGSAYGATASYTPSSAITLYAAWSAGTQTGSITLAGAISKNNTYVDGYTVSFNLNGASGSYNSLVATDTRVWSFKNWNTASNGSGNTYNAGQTYSSNANLTLYAIWTYSTTKGSVTLPTPSRAGYKFMGWAENSSATSGATGAYTPSKSLTLYAIWKPDGTVRIYIDKQYKMSLVYIYLNNKWNLTLPYIYDASQSKWRILGG